MFKPATKLVQPQPVSANMSHNSSTSSINPDSKMVSEDFHRADARARQLVTPQRAIDSSGPRLPQTSLYTGPFPAADTSMNFTDIGAMGFTNFHGPPRNTGVMSPGSDSRSPVDSLANALHCHRLSDPFSEGSSRSSNPSLNHHFQMPHQTSIDNHNSGVASANDIMQIDQYYAGDQKAKASAFAQLIKSGAFTETETTPRGRSANKHEARSSSMAGRSLTRATQSPPVVNHWSSHMVDSIAPPPFLAHVKHGEHPSLEQAVEYVPFVEPSLEFKSSTAGVVAIRKVRHR